MRRADLNALMDRLRQSYGDDAARRVERAADEVHGLDQRYTDTALHHVFAGNADSALVAMKPGDFEKYAARLPEKGYPDYGYFDWDTGADLDYDQYMDYLNTIEHRGGLSDVPFLNVGHEEGADLPYVGAHEGRHRMRAMAKVGKPTGLVMIRPSGRLEESLRHGPTYETAYRDSNQKRQALLDHLAAHDRMVYPQKERDRQDDIRGPEQLPEAFSKGGITGKPSTVKIPGHGEIAADEIPEVMAAKRSYMGHRFGDPRKADIDGYTPFDEAHARKIAEAYEAMQHAPHDPAVRRSYEAMIDETLDQYHALRNAGYDFHFMRDGEPDPYAESPALGYLDAKDGRLTVFPTDQGYGMSMLHSEEMNPLLKRVGRIGDLDNATANDAFRAVHDMFGHHGPGNPFFRHKGEERAWEAHSRMYSDDALPAMTSETRGQNSWLNFGPHEEYNRTANGADTIYAEQKAGLMPEWTWRRHRRADGGSIPGRELNELGMYSKALEEAKAIRQPKGKLSDFLRYLKGGLEEFRRGGWVDRGGYARGGIADYQDELDSANRMMSPDEEGLLAYPRDRYIDPHYRVGALKGWTLNPNLRQDRFLDYPSVNDDIGAPYFNGWNENKGRFRNYADGGAVEREHFEFGGFQDNSRPGQAGDPGNWGAWGNGTEDVSVRDAQAAGLRAGLSRAEVAYGQVPGGLGYRGGSGTSLTNLPELSAANLARAGIFNPGERRVSGNPADAATGMAQPGSVREALGLGKMPEQTQTPEQAVQQVEAQRRQAAAASDPSGFNGLAGGTVALAAFGALPGQHKPGEDMTTPADTGFMSTPEQNSYNRFMDTARNTYMEAGNQSDEGMLGVAFSAPNRTAINYGGIGPGGIDTTGYNDPNASFDENVTRNIYAPKQYSWTNPALNRKTGVVNVDRARDIADAEMAGAPDRAQRAYAAAYAQQFGGATDPTYGAVSYHADYVSPAWRRDAASLGTPTVIGDHTFYGGSPPTATQVAGPGAASVLSTMADPWGFSHMTPVNDLATAPLSWTDRIGAPPATPLGSPRTPTPASAYSVGEDATPLGSPRTPTPATAYAPEGATRTWANPISVPYSDPGFERPGYDISVYQGVPLADITPVRPSAPTLTEQAYNPLSSIRAPSVVDPFTARKVQTERISPPSEEPSYTRAPYHDTVYDAPAATAAAVARRMGWHDSVYDAPSAQASPLGSPRTPTPASAYASPEAAPAAPVARPAAPYGTRGNPLSAADMAAVGLGDATPAQLRSYRADIPRGSMISSDSPYYGTRNNPLSDADMAAAGLGDEQSFSKKYLGFRSNDEVDADNKPYKDPETGQWVDPRFSRTPVGMAALGLLGLGLTAVSPPLGIAYGLSALMGKSPLINGADRLASRFGFDGRTTTTDPNAPSAWGSLKSGVQGQSYAPGYDGAGTGRSLSSFNGNSGGNGYRMYDPVPGPVANPIDVKSKKKAAEPKPEPVRPSDWNDMASWQQELWSDTYG